MSTRVVVRELKPSPRMKLLYAIYYALLAIPYLFCTCLPLALHVLMTGELDLTFLALVLAPVWLTAPAVAYWIHAYYRSARFVLTADEIVVERGVWWRRKDIVPYNRITNLSVVQGPISRALGLATIRVQTAVSQRPRRPVTPWRKPSSSTWRTRTDWPRRS